MIDETKPKRWEPGVLYSAVALVGAAMALAIYWALIPLDVLQIKNDPVPVRPPTNTRGNAEILTHDFCKLANTKGTLRMSFVGETKEVFLPLTAENSSKKCDPKTELPVVIPQDLTPGKYHVHFRATYHPNPLRTVVEEWDSQEFTVQ